MKKQFLRYTSGFIPLIALFTCTYGQSSNPGLPVNNNATTEWAYNNKSKALEMPATGSPTTARINAKAVKNFTKNYKEAANAGWFVIKDGYLAEFKQDGITTKVYYDPKGRWIGNVRSYFEDKLPRDIRHLVKSHYYDYNIFYAQEVTVAGGITVYLVKIEDKTSLKTIRIQDGEMDEFEVLKKSK